MLLNCFVFIDDNVFNKEMLSYNSNKALASLPFQVGSIHRYNPSYLHLSFYRLKPARFKLLITDFITDYVYVQCLNMNNVKGTMRCHKN